MTNLLAKLKLKI